MASWSATDTFESTSTGNLNGQGGGTGWSGNWSTTGATVVSSPTHAGTRAVSFNNTTGTDGSRSLTTGADSGIMRVYFYATNAPTLQRGFYPAILREGTTSRFYLAWGANPANNNEVAMLGSTSVSLGTGLATATWHYVDIQLDQAGGSRARASLNGGAWSAYVTANGGSFTTIDNYRISTGDNNASDQGYYIDDIGVGTGPVTGPTNVKTWDGVTQSTGIKTYFGVALASVKSVNGIT